MLAVDHLVKEGFPDAALFGKRIHILCAQPARDRERIGRILSQAGVEVTSLTPRALSMEDVFVYRVSSLEQKDHTRVKGGVG